MKRIISLLLVIGLTVCCFSGCGGSKKKSGAASILEGETITIAAWGDGITAREAGTELGDARLAKIAEAEEKYGCKIEFVTIADIFSQMKLAASSGEVIADVCSTRAHYIAPLAKQDALWSMEELLGDDMANEVYNQNTFANTKFSDKTYGFWYDPYYVGTVLQFNKGILDRAGIEYPYDLVKSREWTFDKWLEIMQKTTDPASGIMGCGMKQAFDATVIKGNDASIYAFKDNKWVENTADNKVINALNFLADCVTKYKVMDANTGRDWTYVPGQFAAGKYTFTTNYSWDLNSESFKDMSDDYGVLPLPIGPDAKEYVNVACELKTYCIQKSVEKEKAIAILELLNEALAYPLDPDTAIQAYYQSLVKDRESLEVLMMLHDLPVEQVDEYTTPDIRGTACAGVLSSSNGSSPVRSSLESYKGSIQALLDEYYGQ